MSANSFVSRKVMEIALNLSLLYFNKGSTAIYVVFERMGVVSGKLCVSGSAFKDATSNAIKRIKTL
jgi:hypothetical protein